MRLDQVIQGVAIKDRRGDLTQKIGDIATDSRKVNPGDLFVALRGTDVDGHTFIEKAIAQGAKSIMSEEWPADAEGPDKPIVILVEDTRRALALAAANYFGQPSKGMLVSAVTGTNGKTTVTYLVESVMRAAAKSVGAIGTTGCRFAGQEISLSHTTPDPVVLQRTLGTMMEHNVTHVVMEVSSHALAQDRVAGLHFKVAGFTNLTQDHLDYHKDLDDYFEAKASLFSGALAKSRARGRMAVVNIDDPRGEELVKRWGKKTLRVSMTREAEVQLLEANYSLDGTRALVRTPKGDWEIETRLIGPHNLSNTLVAIGMALAMGFSKSRILRGLSACPPIPGRLERVEEQDGNRVVFVDYAHTPDALDKVLGALRSNTANRLMVVFGCGGDRDSDKRSKMGATVAKHADVSIVTNDNPRSESGESIAGQIEEGLREGKMKVADKIGQESGHYLRILNRGEAIKAAVDAMQDGDTLLVAGKGHEREQVVGNTRFFFNDVDAVQAAFRGEVFEADVSVDSTIYEVDMVESEDVEVIAAAQQTESLEADSILDAESEVLVSEAPPPEEEPDS